MTGPYEYVPPVYWLADTQAAALTVTTPKPVPASNPTLESVKAIHSQRTICGR